MEKNFCYLKWFGKNLLFKRRLGFVWFNGFYGDVVNFMGFVRSKLGCLNLKSNCSKYGCFILVIWFIVFLSFLE